LLVSLSFFLSSFLPWFFHTSISLRNLFHLFKREDFFDSSMHVLSDMSPFLSCFFRLSI
jgi:hypothetical protein